MSKRSFNPGPVGPITVGGYNIFEEDRLREAAEKDRQHREESERQSRTISNDCPNPIKLLHNAIRSGNMTGRWVDTALIPMMEAEARKRAKREAEEIVPTAEPEFDPIEEY